MQRSLLTCLALVVSAFFVVSLTAAAEERATREKERQTREEYRIKAEAIDGEQFAARVNLALWCVENDLLEEAQLQLRVAAVIDPRSEQLVALWSKLAEKMPRKRITLAVTLDDGNVIKGTCSPTPFLLRLENGVVLVALEDLKKLDLLDFKGKTPLVQVQTPEGSFKGRLIAPDLVIKSSLGQFTVPFDKIRRFSIETVEQERGEAPPPAPGEVVLTWDQHIGQLRTHGLDIMFVFDSTGSMGSIILEVKTRIRQLMKVVTYLVPNARLGLVTYRDNKKYDLDDYEYTVKYVPLIKGDQEGLQKLERFLRETEAYGGGDTPEAVFEGIECAIQRADWRPSSIKIIIVFGDAPPRPENNGLAKIYSLSREWRTRTGGAVSCIDTTGGSKLLAEFRQLAKEGGGESAFLNDQRAIIKQLIVFIFGSRWQEEIDKAYNSVLAGPGDRLVGE